MSSTDYDHDPQTQKVLDAWEAESQSILQQTFEERSDEEDKILARALSSATSGMSAVSSINAGNRASIADYYSRQLKQQNSKLQNGVGLFGNVLGQTMGAPAQTLGSVLKIF